jgi:hypothetical protein
VVQPTPAQFAADSRAESDAIAAHQARVAAARAAAPVVQTDEARQLAYATGIRQLGPLVDRIIKLERSLQAAHASLDSQVAVINRLVARLDALEAKKK